MVTPHDGAPEFGFRVSVGCVHVSYNPAKEDIILLTRTRMENNVELVRGALLL